MGRPFTTRPTTEAGRKLAEHISRHGLATLSEQLGINRFRLSRLVGGRAIVRSTDITAIARAGIATLQDWSEPAKSTT